METRSATVTKTPFNSYNIVTCTMKELAQCQLEPGSKLFVLFNLVFSPLLFPLPSVPSTRCVRLKKRTGLLEPKRIRSESN